jgi:hypothetical protein
MKTPEFLDLFGSDSLPDSKQPPAIPSWHPTASQTRGLAQLHQLADVFHKVGDGLLAGFQPACRRALIVGTSGAGKTALARQFAAQRGVPIYCIDGGSWTVTGSLKTGTLRQVRDFVRSCEDPTGPNNQDGHDGQNSPGLQGVIWIDEIDKLIPTQEALSQSAWSLSVAAEAISLADSDSRLAGNEWSPRDIQRLRGNFMILAGGAFMAALSQARQSAKRGALGFTEAGEPTSYSSKIRDFLPEELLSRFSSQVILEAPTRADLTDAINRIHCQLGIKRSRSMEELLTEAEGAAGAMRWIETYLCQLIAKHPYSIRPAVGESREKDNQDKKQPRTYDLMVGDVSRCVAGANETIAKLQIRLAVIYSRLHALGNEGREKPYTGMFSNPEFGEAIIRALRNCRLLSTITSDDREEISAFADWRRVAWKVMTENASDLVTYGLTETMAEAWALSGALIEYRSSLSRSAQRGLLG